ncbi:MAG: EamA family transporter [Myxococcales bacterium]|nr:EamA family transporter [Myxococcales bacterium]
MMKKSGLSDTAYGALWVGGSCLATAAMAMVASKAGKQGHWSIVAVGRLGFGLIAAFALIGMTRSRRVRLPSEFWAWMRAIAAGIGVPAAFLALVTTPVADAVTLMNTAPLFVVLIEAGLRRRVPLPSVVMATLVSVVGIGLLERPGFDVLGLGACAALLNGAARALGAVSSSRVSRTTPEMLVVQSSLVATVFGVLVMAGVWLFDRPSLDVSGGTSGFLWLLVAVGILATGADAMAARGLQQGSSRLAPLLFLTPVFVLIGEVLFGGTLTGQRVLAIVLILGGALWASMRQAAEQLVLVGQGVGCPELEAMSAWRDALKTRTAVDVHVHLESEGTLPLDPLVRASELFASLALENSKQRLGLLIYVQSDGQRVLIGDHGIERRVFRHRLAKLLHLSDESFWPSLADELARQLPSGDEPTKKGSN